MGIIERLRTIGIARGPRIPHVSVQRSCSYAPGLDPADILVLDWGSHGRRPIAFAQLDPVLADEFADGLAYPRGDHGAIVQVLTGLLQVAEHVQRRGDVDERTHRRATDALQLLRWLCGEGEKLVR